MMLMAGAFGDDARLVAFMQYMRVVLVAAVGNGGTNAASFPAGDRGVMGVSATDQSDALAGFSNSGADTFLGAPGVGVTADDVGGGTTSVSGTSASAAPPRAAS